MPLFKKAHVKHLYVSYGTCNFFFETTKTDQGKSWVITWSMAHENGVSNKSCSIIFIHAAQHLIQYVFSTITITPSLNQKTDACH